MKPLSPGPRRNPKDEPVDAPEPVAPPSTPMVSQPARSTRRGLLILFCCLAGSAIISFLIFRYVVYRIPSELVGVWQVVDGPLAGSTLEFRPNAIAVAELVGNGQKAVTESSVKVDGKKVFLTTRLPNGRDDTVVQTIETLTDRELVIRDADRRIYRMRRLP